MVISPTPTTRPRSFYSRRRHLVVAHSKGSDNPINCGIDIAILALGNTLAAHNVADAITIPMLDNLQGRDSVLSYLVKPDVLRRYDGKRRLLQEYSPYASDALRVSCARVDDAREAERKVERLCQVILI